MNPTKNPTHIPEVMTAREVSELYFGSRMSYWTVLEQAKTGVLPHRRIGGKYFFHRVALDQMFELNKAS